MAQGFNQKVRILVVEDQVLAQQYLKYALQNLGYINIAMAERAQAAISLCHEVKFDLILCSFDLSKGKDGYQLYEELKERQLIRLSTGFIFISAETEPGLVHSVIELQPDDFLVKPFTLRDLDLRISRVLERKTRLKSVYRALDDNIPEKALVQIEKYLPDQRFSKSIPQMLRIKGELLLHLNDFERAQRFFVSVLKIQKLSWAKIGLIRCLIVLDHEGEAFNQLQLMARQPASQLEALELLSDIQFRRHDYNDALANIKKAATLSPRNIQRQDKLVNIARLTHDYESQYRARRDIVKYAKNSFHDKPEFYLNVARSGIDYALTNYNEEQIYRILKQANDYLVELRSSFPGADMDEQINVINARIHYVKDETDKARLLINDVLESDEPVESIEDALDKAKSFHELGFYNHSEALFDQIEHFCQQHSSEHSSIHTYIKQEKQQREVIKDGPKSLNNTAVNHYRRGNTLEALNAFRQAFVLIPGNSSIALNLLHCILNSDRIDHHSDEFKELIAQCLQTIDKNAIEPEQAQRLEAIKAQLAAAPED